MDLWSDTDGIFSAPDVIFQAHSSPEHARAAGHPPWCLVSAVSWQACDEFPWTLNLLIPLQKNFLKTKVY